MSAPQHDSSGERIAIIGAGIIGCALAWALAREGRRVVLIDRAEPATAGASFGNAGHIACEQREPLPSAAVLRTFWRELSVFGGAVDLPVHRWVALAPWLVRFVQAAFRQQRNTPALAALVAPAADALAAALREIGRPQLLVRHGHYVIWRGPHALERVAHAAAAADALGVCTGPAPHALLHAVRARGGTGDAAGLHYPESGHVIDPRQLALAFAGAAFQAGAQFQQAEVQELTPLGARIGVRTDGRMAPVAAAVVCAGVQSKRLLARCGVPAPLTAERGYHLEMPGTLPLVDAPVLHANHNIIVTPMQGRLRATSYLEFERHGAAPDPRKIARLRARLQALGYRCATAHAGWVGSRPTLPDYLPGLGRAPGEAPLFYAVGHQHLGLTLAVPSAHVMAALVAGRPPPLDARPFDLMRFGHAHAAHR
jgi:glycine/D-amino acid oxidase-like deaminating enzyme